jgi:hypothetical protein
MKKSIRTETGGKLAVIDQLQKWEEKKNCIMGEL